VLRGWPLASLLAALLLAVPAQAEPEPIVGPVYLGDVVTVAANATLTLGPGVQVTGPGHFEVFGSLVIAGDPARRAEVSVPILLMENSTSRFEHARLWGVHGPAVSALGGELEARDVAIEANGEGIVAGSGSRIELTDATLHANAGAALRMNGTANVTISRSLLDGNGRGIDVASGTLLVQDSTLRGDTTLLAVVWDGAPLEARIARNDFAAAHATAGPLVVLRSLAGAGPAVAFAGNRIHGGAVGVLVLGPGPSFESRNDTLDANAVGLSLHAGTARLTGTALGNDRDLEGVESGDVLLDNVTYLRTATATVPMTSARAFSWGAVGLGVAALAIVGLLVAQPVARRLHAQRPSPAAEPMAPVRRVEVPTLSAQELRILRDVAANPGSPQAAVAARLGMTRQALHYHVKKLEARGLLRKVAKGRETLCTVPAEVAASLPRDAETPA
jgi:biotin operon repressor